MQAVWKVGGKIVVVSATGNGLCMRKYSANDVDSEGDINQTSQLFLHIRIGIENGFEHRIYRKWFNSESNYHTSEWHQ